MRIILLLISLAVTTASAARTQAPADVLRADLQARIAASGATVGLYFRDLTRTDSLALDADRRFHAASTMKVAVMVQVYRDADERRLSLRDRLSVTDRFRSIADSSTYQLGPGDDSDSSLYARVGQQVEVEELVERMIRVSSNLATNNLVDRVGPARIRASLAAIGADSMIVHRGVEDGPAFRAGLNNTTTARGFGVLLAAIADGNAASAQACGFMLEVLLGQRSRDGIPAGLPRGTRVAHKTGQITRVHHDGGVVYHRGRPAYVLVVLTEGLAEQAASAQLIADLTRIVHDHAGPGR